MKNLIVLAVFLVACGCRPCDEDSVCDSLEAALQDRAGDCGLNVATDCPYEPLELGPGSGSVCDLAWQCVDKLESDTVSCGDLNGISIASCALASGSE